MRSRGYHPSGGPAPKGTHKGSPSRTGGFLSHGRVTLAGMASRSSPRCPPPCRLPWCVSCSRGGVHRSAACRVEVRVRDTCNVFRAHLEAWPAKAPYLVVCAEAPGFPGPILYFPGEQAAELAAGLAGLVAAGWAPQPAI
jgi:hypothetical protein